MEAPYRGHTERGFPIMQPPLWLVTLNKQYLFVSTERQASFSLRAEDHVTRWKFWEITEITASKI